MANTQPRARTNKAPPPVVEEEATVAAAPNADRSPEHFPANSEEHTPEHVVEHANERIRRRKHASLRFDDPFYVNTKAIPPDVSVEWKRVSNVGEENPFYIAAMREQGWEPVNPREHPDWVPIPPDYQGNTVVKGGLMLMERPMSLTLEARTEDKMISKQQVREAEQRLGKSGPGEMERIVSGGAKLGVDKQMMRPIAIEE